MIRARASGGRLAGRAGHGDRLVGERLPLGAAAGPVEDVHETRDDDGPRGRRRVGRHQVHGAAGGDQGGVDPSRVEEEPRVLGLEQPEAHRVDVGVRLQPGPHPLDDLHRRDVLVADGGDRGRLREDLHRVLADQLGRVGNRGPQPAYPLVLRVRVVVGVDVLRGARRAHRPDQRPAGLVRAVGVLGDGGGAGVRLLERVGEQAVQGASLAGEQVGVERLREQRVAHGEPALGVGHQQVAAHGFVHRGVQVGGQGGVRRDRREHGRGDALAGRRHDAQQLGRGRAARPGPPDQHLAEAGRQRVLVAGQRRPHQRLRGVRVAAGPGVDAGGQGRAEHRPRVAAEEVGQLLCRLDQAQRPDGDLRGQRRPAAVLQPLREGVAHLVLPVGHHDRESLLVKAGAGVRQHLQGGDVGPVHVVEHHHRRRHLGGPVEHRAHRGDEPRLVGHRVGPRPELGQQQRQVARVGTENLRDPVPRQPRRAASAGRRPAGRTASVRRGSPHRRRGRPASRRAAGPAPRRAGGSCPSRPHRVRAPPAARRPPPWSGSRPSRRARCCGPLPADVATPPNSRGAQALPSTSV